MNIEKTTTAAAHGCVLIHEKCHDEDDEDNDDDDDDDGDYNNKDESLSDV